jgi:hypothetical protein
MTKNDVVMDLPFRAVRSNVRAEQDRQSQPSVPTAVRCRDRPRR